jgi:hypothetical protein
MQKLDRFRRRRVRNAATLRAVAATGATLRPRAPVLITLMNLAFDDVGVSGAAISLLSATIFGVKLIRSRSKVAP